MTFQQTILYIQWVIECFSFQIYYLKSQSGHTHTHMLCLRFDLHHQCWNVIANVLADTGSLNALFLICNSLSGISGIRNLNCMEYK